MQTVNGNFYLTPTVCRYNTHSTVLCSQVHSGKLFCYTPGTGGTFAYLLPSRIGYFTPRIEITQANGNKTYFKIPERSMRLGKPVFIAK